MKAGILLFPGTNRDDDIAQALQHVGFQDIVFGWHMQETLPPVDIWLLAGGFAYGDYLRCGAIATYSPAVQALKKWAKAGGYILGICNGFQILCEAGLLPGVLLRNQSGRFLCRDHYVRVETDYSFCSKHYNTGQIVSFPLAHIGGRYYAQQDVLSKLNTEGRILFRYCDILGNTKTDQSNPNGSIENIAGICSENRRIIGMMPHPENVVGIHNNQDKDGLPLFTSILQDLVENKGATV